jgi:tRNA1(Val) A37 N6-methylase TrmN6
MRFMSVTQDGLLDGRVILRQSADGYRAGMDAALLAAACDAREGERVIEAGCGPGAALLAAAVRRSGALFTGVERDPQALALAVENIALNRLGARVTAVGGDVTAPFKALGQAPFDAAMANPPYFDDAKAIRGPAPAKTAAWIAEGGLAAWSAFLLKAVREGGTITVIHRADRLADILQQLGAKAGSFKIRPVQPRDATPAKRVLVRAIKGGRAPLVLLPALVLHQPDGAHTAAAEAILRGGADLPWT